MRSKYCGIRPNICGTRDVCDLRHLDENYVYGIDTIINPLSELELDDESFDIVHAVDVLKYQWDRMLDAGLVTSKSAFGTMIVVRPKCANDRTPICRAVVRSEFVGEEHPCSFYVGGICTCEEPPKFCTQDYDAYGDELFTWGAITRKIIDDWITKQQTMRAVILDVIKCMTKEQRNILVLDEHSPIPDLICTGVVDMELFNGGKINELS